MWVYDLSHAPVDLLRHVFGGVAKQTAAVRKLYLAGGFRLDVLELEPADRYGDMSERVMSLIEAMVPSAEVYSIDEAFADLTGIDGLDALGIEIRARVLRCTGIPVGVGIAHTKTLAKLANHAAKRLQAQTGGRGQHHGPG